MSNKNIYTGIAVLSALVMVLIVFLVTTNKDREDATTKPYHWETRIEVESATNEFGDVTFYTVYQEYLVPGVSSDHTYKPTTRPSTTESPFVEQDSFVYVTNEDGSPVYGEDGKPVTEVVKVTVDKNSVTTAPPPETETRFEVVTDESGAPVTDENGLPVTGAVAVEVTSAPTTDRWAEDNNGGFAPVRDDALASDIIDQINSDRSSVGGRAPLAVELNGVARSDSSFSAMKGFEDRVSGRGMTFVTTYGGVQLYSDIARAMSGKIHSDSATEIGVGVFKSGGKYYTTVIIE